jgi:hypothetical protein
MNQIIASALQFSFEKATPEGKWTCAIILVGLAGLLIWFVLREREK